MTTLSQAGQSFTTNVVKIYILIIIFNKKNSIKGFRKSKRKVKK